MSILSVHKTGTIFMFIALAMVLQSSGQAPVSYRDQIDQWHQQRIAEHQSEHRWFNVVGLYCLTPGRNTLGSGPGQKIQFPNATIPAHAGYFEFADGVVTMVTEPGVNVTVNGKPVQKILAF